MHKFVFCRDTHKRFSIKARVGRGQEHGGGSHMPWGEEISAKETKGKRMKVATFTHTQSHKQSHTNNICLHLVLQVDIVKGEVLVQTL